VRPGYESGSKTLNATGEAVLRWLDRCSGTEALDRVLQHLPAESVHLTGGAIRDHFVGRERPRDLDLVVDLPPSEIFPSLDRTYRHRPTVFGNRSYRVGAWTVDVFPAATITGRLVPVEVALTYSDLSINSLAVRCSDAELLDPMDGMRDIRDRRARPLPRGWDGDEQLQALLMERFLELVERFDLRIPDWSVVDAAANRLEDCGNDSYTRVVARYRERRGLDQ
jgi:hypothetical protein